MRFVGEVAATGGVGPALGEAGVDRGQHGVEPSGQFAGVRDAQGNAGPADLVLRADQALGHGGGRGQEGSGDPRGVQAEDGLQHQRRADRGIDGGMGAGEHQAEAVVRDRVIRGRGVGEFLGEQPDVLGGGIAVAPAAGGVDQPAAGDGHQPGLRVAGHAACGPVGEGGGEGVGQRVLGRGNVAGARGEEGDQPAVAAAGGEFGCPAGILVALARHHMAQIGRTSIAPWLAPGQRAAQESAASRSATSIR